MKRNISNLSTASLLGAGLVLGAASPAQAGFPTVYGKINVSANQYDLEKIDFAERTPAFPAVAPTATDPGRAAVASTYRNSGATATASELDQWAIESNSSRLGVRGDADLSSSLKALYVLEFGVDADNGSSGGQTFSQRNIWAGLQGNWGTLAAGKIDTPLKTIQTNSIVRGDIDRFNDLALADIQAYLVGENRADNVLLYTSPLFAGGVEVKLAAIQNEETGVENSATDKQDDNGIGAGSSVSVTYGKASWFVGLGADSNVSTTDAIRAVGEVGFGPVKIGAIYQTAEQHESFDKIAPFSSAYGSTASTKGASNGANPLNEWDGASGSSYKEQDGYVLNAAWKIAGPWTAKAQYGFSESTPFAAAGATQYDDVEATAIAVGADYKLNDTAKLYGYYATLETEGDVLVSTETVTDKVASIGFDLTF